MNSQRIHLLFICFLLAGCVTQKPVNLQPAVIPQTSVPTGTATGAPQPSITPTPILPPIEIPEYAARVVDETFEKAGSVNFITDGNGLNVWSVLEDESGNPVLQAQNETDGFNHIFFGPRSFMDGIIQYRFRLVERQAAGNGSGLEYLYFRMRDGFSVDTYALQFDFANKAGILNYVPPGNQSWSTLGNFNGDDKENEWRRLTVAVTGYAIQVWMDNQLVIAYEDDQKRIREGGLGLQVGPFTTVQFDDVQVWQTDKPVPANTQTPIPTLPPFIRPGDSIPYMKGFLFRPSDSTSFQTALFDRSLLAMRDTGAEWVAFFVNPGRENASDVRIRDYSWTASEEDLYHAITLAHQLGFKVILRPKVGAQDGSFLFGESLTPDQWAVFFANYREMLLKYARLAQRTHVEVFSVGYEMYYEAQQEKYWREIIPEVRQEYEGLLTYGANHGDEWTVKWWDLVDFIGIDAYYVLSEQPNPTREALALAWQPIAASLERLSQTYDRPVVFTEIGYSSITGAASEPWGGSSRQVDPEIQALLYQAAFDAFRDKPWFKGFFWYGWELSPYQGGKCNGSFTPARKPAENVIRTEFGAPVIDLDANVHLPKLEGPNLEQLWIFQDEIPPSIEFSSTTPVRPNTATVSSGTASIEAFFAQGQDMLIGFWGGVNPDLYQWLEFDLYTDRPELLYQINIVPRNEIHQVYNPVFLDSCVFFDGGLVQPEQWTRVRIPMDAFEFDHGPLYFFSWYFSVDNPQPFTLYLDNMRLVGAGE